MTPLRSRPALVTFAALGAITLLAGCSSSDATTTDATVGATAGATPDATTEAAASGSYTDGDYAASGTYQSPGGEESIEVELTLEGGVVTAVTVTGDASSGNAERYQSQFADGISAEVVGQSIDELDVDTVAGSSLTSDGFDAAVDEIKADAAA